MNLMNAHSIQNLVILNKLKYNNQYKILKEFPNNPLIQIYLEIKTIDILLYIYFNILKYH